MLGTGLSFREILEIHGPPNATGIGGTLVSILVFELFSLETTRAVLKQPNGRDLYIKAILLNLFNYICLAFPLGVITGAVNVSKEEFPPLKMVWSAAQILFISSVIYYFVHKAFHTYPSLYRIHKFHHRFHTHTPPVAANAVSPAEFILAYFFPIGVALSMVHTDRSSSQLAVRFMSLLNLLVHTPRVEAWSQKHLPRWWVSTHDHLEHHRKLNTKYASPTFNVDYLVSKLQK